ncbi:hypothetical protein P170DRAFT_399638 [Aspergillus steynii IBT 23096]|uniref:Zn(2)-C6 fungal-type domain-containing protein n=1 Tax=Aspergillus steynii IBT 23096 TaxID=1392250 RepID=A0A2I2GRI0_9EURO|nr:uncharacterized protein P170DRAFT_399638 [Aspergillus steynii IBT 23096]PLB55478.1 hypothetical protein P170DRAFT_399638 [Aspergillus steynii IBT 23096]
MTRSTGTRLYRACIRCRQRKTKCDLYYESSSGHQPCSKCSTEGFDCVVAGSSRGGDYSHLRKRRRCQYRRQIIRNSDGSENQSISPKLSMDNVPEESQGYDIHGGIQNPLEALQILAQTASSERVTYRRASTLPELPKNNLEFRDGTGSHVPGDKPSLRESEIIQDGVVDIQMLEPLLQYYASNHHPYLPIVPSHLISGETMKHHWAYEPFLLAAVLTISTQNRQGLESLHTRVLGYMEKLLLRVVLGSRNVRQVGSVEGLLLLAEWVPHINSGTNQGETSEEDSLAWNLIGLAVRQAYLFHLERYSFRGEGKAESEPVASRKRLAWIFTYLADRQISIQMGQAFWCRGPGLSARFTAHDYPSLRPQRAGQSDYASFVQAQVELTTIFGNVHDILYASKSHTGQLILMGDYTKYLDDGAKALDMWKMSWSNVNVPSHLNGLLTLQFEYLRLYINAFAFQAVLYRSSGIDPASDHEKGVSCFPYSVMASPDGRHIYIAIDAAQNVLRELLDQLNPSRHLRFLPVRYYMSEIHASVFLFKAHTVGALSPGEYQSCFTLSRQFISMLKDAATTPTHIASKYAKLLASLWFQGQSTTEATKAIFHAPSPEKRSTATPSLPPAALEELQDIPEGAASGDTGMQYPITDSFPDTARLSFMDSADLLHCPDVFLANLPFLRAGFPDLDDDGADPFLMSDLHHL